MILIQTEIIRNNIANFDQFAISYFDQFAIQLFQFISIPSFKVRSVIIIFLMFRVVF